MQVGRRTLGAAPAPLLDSTAREALHLVFAPEGSYAAELLAEVPSAAIVMHRPLLAKLSVLMTSAALEFAELLLLLSAM